MNVLPGMARTAKIGKVLSFGAGDLKSAAVISNFTIKDFFSVD
jgi:hypothetical protein